MKSIVITSLMYMLGLLVFGQKENFDLVDYQVPSGWKKDKKEGMVQLTKQDESRGSYCIITLYKSIDGSEDAKANFDLSWNTLVKETFNVLAAPDMQPAVKEKGWEALSGYATFEKEGMRGVALLVNSTGAKKMVNILVLVNSGDYEQEIQNFLASVDLHLPKANPAAKTSVHPESPKNDNPVTKPGFAYHSTNFDDGWTSTIHDDYVLVTRNDIQVYLSYAEKFNASDYSGTGKQVRFDYWQKFVGAYFATGDMIYDNGGALSRFSQDYIEGWGTDKRSGKRRYLAMMVRIIPYTGTLSIVLASAESSAALRKQFPKADGIFDNDLLPMTGYNKFAVGKDDLVGSWVSAPAGATVSWYSTTTGNYVGATGVATSDVFRFGPTGNYSSTHNGGYGVVGALNTFQQEYKGAYTVSNWTLTATKRWDGKTEVFDAWFEIIKGGRVLQLQNNSMKMSLFKEK